MKKGAVIGIIVVAAVIAAAAVIVSLVRGREDVPPGASGQALSFQAVVLEANEGAEGAASLFLYNLDGGAYADQLCYASIGPDTRVIGQDGETLTWEAIPVDSIVRVTHSDVVQSIYPSNYPQVYAVQLVGAATREQLDKALAAKDEWAAQAIPDQPGGESAAGSGPAASGYVDPPADTALYRGIIESIRPEGDKTLITLAQPAGADYGVPSLLAEVGADTRRGFDLASLQEGDYLEVWYGVAPGGAPGGDAPVPAAAANLLPDASLSVFNGTVTDITDNGDGTGSLLLAPIGEGQETLFRYDDGTQFYLDTASLKAGTALNIHFSGATTRSVPPQAVALEVRPYSPKA